jgi:hypothetical protein
MACFTKPLQWLRDLFFSWVVNESNNYTVDYFDLGFVYNVGDVVYNFWIYTGTGEIAGDMCLYVCTQQTTGVQTCDNTQYFDKISNGLIGFNSYNYLNAQTILFEYALNKIFYTNYFAFLFRQPSTGLRSSIYIENLESKNAFFVGYDETESSNVIYSNSEAINFIYDSDVIEDPNNYIIYIPTDFNDAIVLSGQTKETFMANIINRFNLSGMSYKIEIY